MDVITLTPADYKELNNNVQILIEKINNIEKHVDAPLKKIFNISDAAKYVHLGRSKFYSLMKEGVFAPVKDSKNLFNREQLDAFNNRK